MNTAKPGYYQCLEDTTVTYSWRSTNSTIHDVKAYPAIITDWYWGYVNGQGSANLSVIINSMPIIIVNWLVQHTNTGNNETYDTAFDIWLGGMNEQNPSGPSTEVMIWINHLYNNPLGSYIETIAIWNSEFEAHAYWGGAYAWNAFSFVQKQNTWSFNNINLFEFFNYLWNTK